MQYLVCQVLSRKGMHGLVDISLYQTHKYLRYMSALIDTQCFSWDGPPASWYWPTTKAWYFLVTTAGDYCRWKWLIQPYRLPDQHRKVQAPLLSHHTFTLEPRGCLSDINEIQAMSCSDLFGAIMADSTGWRTDMLQGQELLALTVVLLLSCVLENLKAYCTCYVEVSVVQPPFGPILVRWLTSYFTCLSYDPVASHDRYLAVQCMPSLILHLSLFPIPTSLLFLLHYILLKQTTKLT